MKNIFHLRGPEFAKIIHSFARTGKGEEAFWKAMAERVEKDFSEFTDLLSLKSISLIVWSFKHNPHSIDFDDLSKKFLHHVNNKNQLFREIKDISGMQLCNLVQAFAFYQIKIENFSPDNEIFLISKIKKEVLKEKLTVLNANLVALQQGSPFFHKALRDLVDEIQKRKPVFLSAKKYKDLS